MNIWILVWRNLLRRKGRFIFTLAGVGIGMAAFVALLTIGQGLNHQIQQQAQGLGANLVVTPKGWCAYEQISVLTGEQLPEAIPMKEVIKIQALPGIKAIPFLNERTAFRNRPVPVIGIPEVEMWALHQWSLASGHYFKDPNDKSVVIGSGIAQQFDLKPGDQFRVRGHQLPIIGILNETGTKDDVAAFLTLSVTQSIYDVKDMVSFVTVQVEDLSHLEAVSLKIQEIANVAVVSDKQLVSSILAIVGSVGSAMQAVAAVGILAAAFGIINTLLTAVYERRREIGILQALGGQHSTIFATFILESGIYGLLGGIIGIFLGTLVTFWFGPALMENPFTASLQQNPIPSLDMMTLIYTVLLSILLAIVAGLYPAYRAAKLSPVEAMRYA